MGTNTICRYNREKGKERLAKVCVQERIHGIYHILGLDHENDKMAEIMEKKEVALLNKLNIRNPYN